MIAPASVDMAPEVFAIAAHSLRIRNWCIYAFYGALKIMMS